MEDHKFQSIFDEAHFMGDKAAREAVPTPMVVTQHTDTMDDSSPAKKQWYVSEGMCGFAWVMIKPGTSRLARWFKRMNLASRDSYNGGLSMWVGDYGQSYERKRAYAAAFSKVYQALGFNVYSMSRLD